MDPEQVEDFGQWLIGVPWDEVFHATGSNDKANAYEATLNAGVAEFFPLITTWRKDTDPPWINATVRRKIRRRRAVYEREGRSEKWKKLKKATGARNEKE